MILYSFTILTDEIVRLEQQLFCLPHLDQRQEGYPARSEPSQVHQVRGHLNNVVPERSFRAVEFA